MSQPFRHEFDLDPNLIYLNSGTFSITPRCVLNAISRHQQDYEKNPTVSLIGTWTKLWKIHQALGAFFQADPHDLFLRPNVTSALNEFLFGIPLEAPAEILVTDMEYGAIVNICRLRAQRNPGITLRTLQLPTASSTLTEENLIQHILSQLRPETKLLLISHVMTGTGLVIPIQKLARETRSRGILLTIDGAHAPGALDLDFRELENVDFYGGNLHKWMMGPKGTGFGWVPKRHQETLWPLQGGWTSFEIPAHIQGFADNHPFTLRFLMSSCHNFAPFFALEDMLEFWNHHGKQNIFNRICELQSCVEKEMSQKLGWPCLSPNVGPLRGPLLTYTLPEKLEAEGFALMERVLREHRLQIVSTPVQGRFRLRLSPHIYNNEEEIHRAVEILKNQA